MNRLLNVVLEGVELAISAVIIAVLVPIGIVVILHMLLNTQNGQFGLAYWSTLPVRILAWIGAHKTLYWLVEHDLIR